MTRDHLRPAILLFLLSILPFLPVLKADYLNWDDNLYYTENPAIESPGGWKIYLSRFTTDANVYPVVFLSFKIENLLFGEKAMVSHAINLILHGLVSVAAFLLLIRWVSDWKIAFWAGLLFAVHPLQVSTVAWVAERKSLLGTLFFLLALIAAGSKKPAVLWMSLPAVALAYLCKSPLVVFPAVLIGADLLSSTRPGMNSRANHTKSLSGLNEESPFSGLRMVSADFRTRRALWGAHLLLAAGFAWIYSAREVSQDLSISDKLELIPRTLWHYLSEWALPNQLVPLYPKWELTGEPLAMFGWIPIMAFVIAMLLFRKRIDPNEWFGVLLFAITIAPALGIVSFGYQKHSYVSDHFMYLPVLGLSILLSSLMTRISLGRKLFFPILCVSLAILWGMISWQQCRYVWNNPTAFWQTVLRADEESWTAHENLATYLDGQGEIEEAFNHYRKAVEIDPTEPIGWINLGRNLIVQGLYPEAARALAKAIDLNVYYVEAHLFRAEAFLRMGEEQKAVDQFHSAIAVRGGNAEARLKIADLLLHAEDRQVWNPVQALRWLRPFIDAPPSQSSQIAWSLMAEAHARLGEFEEAVSFERRRLDFISDPTSEVAGQIERRIGFYQRRLAP